MVYEIYLYLYLYLSGKLSFPYLFFIEKTKVGFQLRS